MSSGLSGRRSDPPRHNLGQIAINDRLDVVAMVEVGEVKAVRGKGGGMMQGIQGNSGRARERTACGGIIISPVWRAGAPQAHGVDGIVAVAWHRGVVRDGEHWRIHGQQA